MLDRNVNFPRYMLSASLQGTLMWYQGTKCNKTQFYPKILQRYKKCKEQRETEQHIEK